MSGGGWGLVVAVVLGLVISEFSELSPWLAQKLIRWAARVRYPTRVEELSALIAERPGKLFKLVTASGFACAALTYRVTHRKTDPVRSMTSRLWIGLGSALAAGVLLTGEILLMIAIGNHVPTADELSNWFPELIEFGSFAAFATAAELLVPSRLAAGWATAVVSFVLFVIVFQFPIHDVESLVFVGGEMVVVAGVTACTIRLGSRLRFSAIAPSSTILMGHLLTLIFGKMFWSMSASTPWYVNALVATLGYGFALGFSVGVGVHLWQVLCGRRLSQPSPSRTAT